MSSASSSATRVETTARYARVTKKRVRETGDRGRAQPPFPAIGPAPPDRDRPNPRSGFVVVMTCSQAGAACPLVEGARARVAIPYEDPKVADGTPEETARYDGRVEQIGRDFAWVFSEVAKRVRR